MDIYRFFHPHHNPRLHFTKLRQLELSELEQAASELKKALVRAQERVKRAPIPPLMSEHFVDVLKAIDFVERSLQTLSDAHSGDQHSDLIQLIEERSQFTAWEAWTSLFAEQLGIESNRIKNASNQGSAANQNSRAKQADELIQKKVAN